MIKNSFFRKTLLIAVSAAMIAASTCSTFANAEETGGIETVINEDDGASEPEDNFIDKTDEEFAEEDTDSESNETDDGSENVVADNDSESTVDDAVSETDDAFSGSAEDIPEADSNFNNAAETVSKYEKNDSSSDTSTIQDDVANATLGVLKGTFDVLKEKVPVIAVFGDPIKDLVGKAFGIDTADPVIDKLDSIQKSIDQAVTDINSNTKDTIVLGNYGTILNKLDSLANTVNDDIKDIRKRTDLTEEQKTQEIAKLYTARSELRTQIDLAAKVFNGDTMDEPSGRSLYKVIYDTAASGPYVCTSGQAIKESTPYLTKAMGQFVKANAVLDELMTQYEKVNGPYSLKATREKMDDRFIGTIDKTGKTVRKGLLQKYEEFFKQNPDIELKPSGNAGATGTW